MCLILHRPKGIAIPSEWIENSLTNNPDGWGIMGTRNGRLIVKRGLKRHKFERALAAFGDDEIFIHWRYATHGLTNINNCHPFVIADGHFAVMHNGIINIDRKDKSRSDTYHFAHDILEPLLLANPDIIGDPSFAETIAKTVGDGNKLAVLRSNGQSAIVNRKSGDIRGGCWLSNLYSIASPWLPSYTDEVSDVWDLEDLSRYSEKDLISACETYPEEVAAAIKAHFESRSRSRWDDFNFSNGSAWDYR